MADLRTLAGVAAAMPTKPLHALLMDRQPQEIGDLLPRLWPDPDAEPDRPWDCVYAIMARLRSWLAQAGYVLARYAAPGRRSPCRYRIERRPE